MKYVFIIILSILFIGCKSDNEDNVQYFSRKSLSNRKIHIDSLVLTNNSFSGSGFLKIIDNKICFFDRSYYLVSVYDTTGILLENRLGLGNGPKEIDQFEHYMGDGKGNNLFFGLDYIFRPYNSEWTKSNRNFTFNWEKRKGIYKVFNAEDANMYDFNWPSSRYSSSNFPIDSKQMIYIPVNVIAAVSPNVNKYINSEKYFKEVHTIGILDSKTGRLKKVFGNLPKVYNSGKFLTHYAYSYMAIKQDSIFVNYAADHKIYVYDQDHEIKYSFGLPGKGMDTNYPVSPNLKEHKRIRIKAENDYGYYTTIFIDSPRDMVFRFYTKGNGKYSGLQIYKNKILTHDIDVPKRFSVIGKINDYYYASGIIDERRNVLGIYKFKVS